MDYQYYVRELLMTLLVQVLVIVVLEFYFWVGVKVRQEFYLRGDIVGQVRVVIVYSCQVFFFRFGLGLGFLLKNCRLFSVFIFYFMSQIVLVESLVFIFLVCVRIKNLGGRGMESKGGGVMGCYYIYCLVLRIQFFFSWEEEMVFKD